MKVNIVILLSLFIALLGCKKEDENNQQHSLEGDYTGIFDRNGNTSNVTLSLNEGTFNGSSEIEKFPAICNGTYIVSGNRITFTNVCNWTADFDWTLILDDEWNYNLSNDMLTMTKANGDQYVLSKE